MRAVRYYAHGGPGVLQVDDVPFPTPENGQVLIEVEAIGANVIDTLFRRGRSVDTSFTGHPHRRYRRRRFRTRGRCGRGDRWGAGCCLVRGCLRRLRDGRCDVAGAGARGCRRGGGDRVVDDRTLGIATSASGSSAAQRDDSRSGGGRRRRASRSPTGRIAGSTVIGTASSPNKLSFVRSCGADVAIDYSNPVWPEEVVLPHHEV